MTDQPVALKLPELADMIIEFIQTQVKAFCEDQPIAIAVCDWPNQSIIAYHLDRRAEHTDLEWAKAKAQMAAGRSTSTLDYYRNLAAVKKIPLFHVLNEQRARLLVGGVCLMRNDKPLLAFGIHGLGVAEYISNPPLTTEFPNHAEARTAREYFQRMLADGPNKKETPR